MGAIFAVAANKVPHGLVDFFHGLQVAIMMAVMLNIVQFAWWTVRRDKTSKSHCSRYYSVYVLLVAAILTNVQPMCMLVISSWGFPNFFFDGADTGVSCELSSKCTSTFCNSPVFSCDNFTGACAIVPCTLGELDCSCASPSNALQPNTTIGWMITLFGTYLGFILLFIGVFGATQLHKKIMKKWTELRGVVQARSNLEEGGAEEDCAT